MRLQRVPEWLVVLSVHLNAFTGGPDGYSFCARIWEGQKRGNALSRILVVLTDRVFWWDPNHCRKAWMARKRGGYGKHPDIFGIRWPT